VQNEKDPSRSAQQNERREEFGSVRSVRIVGAGRAGGAFALALGEAGWTVELVVKGVPLADAATGVDLLILCVPDAEVAGVASSVVEGPAVVAHCAGALTLDALGRHRHRASIHPLVSLPSAATGSVRLRDGAWFGVAAVDELSRAVAADVVDSLGGRVIEPPEDARAAYHAAAAVASNHLVALMGQVERIGSGLGVPLDAYLGLARGSLDNVEVLGPAAALTGPVARGDWPTVRAHLDALDAEERDGYRAMVYEAARLAGREVPPL